MDHQNPSQDTVPMPRPGRRMTGRTGRIAASAVAAAVLIAGGTAIGIAVTGGASAATPGTAGTGTTAASTKTSGAHPGACRKLAARLDQAGHPVAARKLTILCGSRLLRLAVAGGIHGEITFKGNPQPRTVAFERGTVQALSGSSVTVQATDGTSWTWDIVASTVIRENGHKVNGASLADGELVFVAGQATASGHKDARVIRIRSTG